MPPNEPAPTTFAQEIEQAAGGEAIEGIVLSPERGYDYDGIVSPVQQWAEVRDELDYDYDRGYGGIDCHAIVAWTSSRVIFVAEYDGATGVEWLPRNPEPATPRGI